MSASAIVETLVRKMDEQCPGLCWGIAFGAAETAHPDEEAAITRAVSARQTEFRLGRMAARRALAGLGVNAPVPMGADRAPVWPAGVVGSITHHDGIAVAVVAHQGALGLDLDGTAPLAPELVAEICRPEEDAAEARRIFSAKEAAFKAQYPTNRVVFGFHGLSVDLKAGLATWPDHPETATIPPDSRRPLPILQQSGDGWLLSLTYLPD